MHLTIDGSGFYAEITIEDEGQRDFRLLQLDGGAWYLGKGDGAKGLNIAQGRVAYADVIARAIKIIQVDISNTKKGEVDNDH